MTQTNPKFRNGQYAGFSSSDEILEACEDVAGYEFDLDDPEHCAARAIWADPTPEQERAVIAAAWGYAAPDETELVWGQTVITRPVDGEG